MHEKDHGSPKATSSSMTRSRGLCSQESFNNFGNSDGVLVFSVSVVALVFYKSHCFGIHGERMNRLSVKSDNDAKHEVSSID